MLIVAVSVRRPEEALHLIAFNYENYSIINKQDEQEEEITREP